MANKHEGPPSDTPQFDVWKALDWLRDESPALYQWVNSRLSATTTLERQLSEAQERVQSWEATYEYAKKEARQAMNAAYLAGFDASGEGWNAEYPFYDRKPEDDERWITKRDAALRALLKEKP